MAFGNPYRDPWSMDLLVHWVGELRRLGVRTIALSNTSVEIHKTMISEVFSILVPMFPDVESGLHLHTTNRDWFSSVAAAYDAGCRRFDGVIKGWGGCPMAGKELLGNLKTENLIEFAKKKETNLNIDNVELLKAYQVAGEIFLTPEAPEGDLSHLFHG